MEKSNSSNQSFQVIEDFLNDNFYFKNEKYKTIYESLYIKNKEEINSFINYLQSSTSSSDLDDLIYLKSRYYRLLSYISSNDRFLNISAECISFSLHKDIYNLTFQVIRFNYKINVPILIVKNKSDLDCFLALYRLFFAFYQKNNVIVDSIIVIDINMANFRTENPFESIEIDLIKDNNESLIFKNKRINKVIFDNITDFTYFSTLEAYKKCFVFKGKDFFDSLGGELLNLKAGSL